MRRRNDYFSYYYDDSYWEQYRLPPNHEELASAISLTYSSKRDLYFKLSRSILIEGGNKMVWLYSSKGVAMMVSAKGLDISEGFDSACWQWVSIDGSRFETAAELKRVDNFEVWQRIDCSLLTPDVEYTVSFVLKIDKARMPECPTPFTFSLKSIDGKVQTKSAIYLNDYRKNVEGCTKTTVKDDLQRWEEFVVGEFTYQKTGVRSEIEVSMENKDTSFMKTGIAIDGVKFKPK